jgi:hypothetical protein
VGIFWLSCTPSTINSATEISQVCGFAEIPALAFKTDIYRLFITGFES